MPKLSEDQEYLDVLLEFQNFASSKGEPYRLAAISAFRGWMRRRDDGQPLDAAIADGVAVRHLLRERLSRPHRLLAVMLYASELTTAEAAEVLQIPVSRCIEMQSEIFQLALSIKAGVDAGETF